MTTEYKYDVGEERTERIYNALREATTYLTDVEVLRTILNFFAADLAEHPVEPTREQWDYIVCQTGGVFSNLQRIMFRVPQEPPFDPEKVRRMLFTQGDYILHDQAAVSGVDYDKLLALYKEAVGK